MDLTVLEGLQGLIALVAVAVGVTGLLGESGLRRTIEAWIDIHLLFALLLCGLALIRRGCRQLSRDLCLLVLLVLGIREALGLLDRIWHFGAVGLSLLDASMLKGPDRAGWNPHDDFQLFIASALVVWVFARVVAFRTWNSRGG